MNALESATRRIQISVIVPLLNEASCLVELHRRIVAVLEQQVRSFEIIFVDDGSTDESFEILATLHRQDARVKVIRFRKNFGKAPALKAGFSEADGDIILTLDADLQDVPEEIPKLLTTLDQGYDLVSGWKTKRQDPLTRTISSRIFNWLVSALTGIKIHDFNSGFKCYRREVCEEIHLYGELHRYIPVLAAWRGFRIGEVPVEHQPRRYGRSKYGPMRVYRGFFDLLTVMALTRYSQRPLHLFGLLGFLLGTMGVSINAYLAIKWWFGYWIGNRPLFFLGILLIVVGFQLIFFGLLAEMIGYSSPNDNFTVRCKLIHDNPTEPRP